jgi:hypothetical protein
MFFKNTVLFCCAISLSSLSALALAQTETNSIAPYRPSVSSPAQLPLAGQLEFEMGFLRLKQGDQRRDSSPYQFKLAFDTQWGLLVGGESLVSSQSSPGKTERGMGDTNIVLKRAFIIDEVSAFGLEFGGKIATAKNTIGSGRNDFGINSIYSRDLGKVHMDANFNLTHLGVVDIGSSSVQKGLSASFSMPIVDQWGVTAELSGTQRKGSDSTSQTVVALTYSPSNRLTVDVGFVKGWNKASPDWSFFTGFVLPVGKLF